MLSKHEVDLVGTEQYKTQFKGIWIQKEKYSDGSVIYFLGHDKDFDGKEFKYYPTDKDIRQFRNELIKRYEENVFI